MLMVSCCYQIGEGTQRAGVGCFIFNLLSLPNTLSIRENPPSSRGSEDGKESEEWPLWSCPTPLLQIKSRTSTLPYECLVPRKELAGTGEEHSGQRRPHSPFHLQQ